MAKAYYAKLRIFNDGGRDVLVMPDKGKPDGFIIQSGKPLEITLIDLSTDGKSVSPVLFNGTDKETGLPFLINNRQRPYNVTAVESQLEYTDLQINPPGKVFIYLFFALAL